MNQCKNTESCIRRWAKRHGHIVRKSRIRSNFNFYNQGGYMLLDAEWNTVAVGEYYDASLEDIACYLEKCDAALES